MNAAHKQQHHHQPRNHPPAGAVAGAHTGVENYTTAQKNINSAILEYLLKHGFMKSVDVFQEELAASKNNIQRNLILDENTGLNYMINAFNLGKREHFFISWNRFVPLSLRQHDIICQKLEFYIHIYFAIFPIHPNNPQVNEKELKKELLAFKAFLDTKGAELSKTSEFLQYYALPYVTHPLEHPIFKGLCTKKWGNDLKNKLKQFLQESLPKISSPQIFHWYANFKKRQGPAGGKNDQVMAPELDDMKERLLMLQKHYLIVQKKEEYTKQTLIESQSKWTNFSKEILNISKELLFSMEQMGAKVTLNKISLVPIRDKMARYEAFLNNNADELQNKHGISVNKRSFLQNIHQQQQQQQQYMGGQPGYQGQSPLGLQPMDHSFEDEVSPIQQQLQNRFEDQQQQQQELAPLNFQKIKHFLMSANEELKICATLQALRWRLTKARRKISVKQVIYSYMQYDLLGCMNSDQQFDQGHRVLDRLLQGSKRQLEYSMTFINALASECLGRTYLLQKQDLVEVLVHILHSEQADTSLRQNALGTLQKFSLRRRPQTIMIQLNMIKWIANVLRNEGDSLSDYSIEYATALLMNLSLRAAGKDKCEDPSIELLKVLNDLVEHENLQVRTYVNGTLYSIFTRKKLREEAKELGMPEVLQYLMQQSDDQFKRQIQYILDQLNTQNQNEGNETSSINPNEVDEEDFDDEEEDEEDDDDDEEDMVEEEEGEFNDIIDEQGILVGEDLLVNEFIASQDEGINQIRQVQMLMERERQKRNQMQMQQQNSVSDSSPYSQQHQRADGRPLMRPITPIKSATQMNRLQHSTNTSNITANHNYAEQQQMANQFDETDRNLPSELQSRPRVSRTPYGNERQSQQFQQNSLTRKQDIPQQQQDQAHEQEGSMKEDNKLPIITKKGKQITDEEMKEIEEAFAVRERIVRSPPEPPKAFGQKKRTQPSKQGHIQKPQPNQFYYYSTAQPAKIKERTGMFVYNQQKPSRQGSPLCSGDISNILNNKSFCGTQTSTTQHSYRNPKKATKKSTSRKQQEQHIPRSRPHSQLNYASHQPQSSDHQLMNKSMHKHGELKTPNGMVVTSSNLSTMRNVNSLQNFQNTKKSPATVKMGNSFYVNQSPTRNQTNSNSKHQLEAQFLSSTNVYNDLAAMNGTSALSDISNKNNFSCIILRSNEKQRTMNSSNKKTKENVSYIQQQYRPPTNFGQRLEEIEADAQALKRSMLETSKDNVSYYQESVPSQQEYKQCKRTLQKTQAKYQSLIKEHSALQHDFQVKDMQIQRINQELQQSRAEAESAANKLKQLRYENDRLFYECTTLKNSQTSATQMTDKSQFNETSHMLELEQENFRKKVKRLTGEVDALETYFESFQGLLKQVIPASTQPAANKLIRSMLDSIEYIRDLFQHSKLNVTQGKKVQRKVRYEKLKTEFQSLVIQLCSAKPVQLDQSLKSQQQITSREQDFLKDRVDQLQTQLEKEKIDHQKKIEQYKEQVIRMRENIDLFKENIRLLKDSNVELQQKIHVQSSVSSTDNEQMQHLFHGLKEDNERMVEELKRIQDENYQLQQYLGVSKETIQQQNGIIKGLQSVVESFQNNNATQEIRQDQFFTTNKYNSSKQERSKSCHSNSVEQNRQVHKPALLHQSLVFPQRLQQNFGNFQNQQETQRIDLSSTPLSPVYDNQPHFQSQTMNHPRKQMHRSYSNLSHHSNQMNALPSNRVQNAQFNQYDMNVSQVFDPLPQQNQTLNISNFNTNHLSKGSLLLENTTNNNLNNINQDQSCNFHDSFIKYLAAEQKINSYIPEDNHSQLLDISQQIHAQTLLEACGSPMTARFSTFQQQLSKQGKHFVNQNDISRENIKQNTKNLIGEIQGIDQDIVSLQRTMMNAFAQERQQPDFHGQQVNGELQRNIDYSVSQSNPNDFSLLDDQLCD